MAAANSRKTKKRTPAQRILVATDFSRDANEALRVATTLAQETGSAIVLLHVDEPLMESARSNTRLVRRQKVLADLEGVRRAIEAQGVKAEAVVTVGNPAREIVTAAAAEPTRFIVMGTRGHSPVVATLLGGVAYDVVRKATCPVLTVRSSRVHPPQEARRTRRR